MDVIRQTYRRISFGKLVLRRFAFVFGTLLVSLSSFFTLTPAAFAAAPQYTYSWVKNIGTHGCSQWFTDVAYYGGKVYTVNTTDNNVEVFDTNGTLLSSFGSYGTTGNGKFQYPNGIALDATGNIYVADSGNNRIQKFDTNGNYLSQFGSWGSGNGQFNGPGDVAVDASGNIYVADTANQRIEKFNSAGVYQSQFATKAGGTGTALAPSYLTLDSAGNIYVTADMYPNFYVQKYNSAGTYISQFGGARGSGNGQFNDPTGIALDSAGNIYVGDNGNSRVQKFDASGTYLSQIGSAGNGDGQLRYPDGIALDPSGNVYVADSGNHRVQKFDSSGAYSAQLYAYDSSSLCEPVASVLGPDGNLYVLDSSFWNGKGWDNIKVYNPSNGVLLRTIGSQGFDEGQISGAGGMAISPSGTIYIADDNNNRVTMYNLNGTYIGQFGGCGTGDGQLCSPEGVALDAAGNVYVTDTSNDRVEKFTSTGTYISQFGTSGTGNGQFTSPEGIAVDSAGNIYVNDYNWNSGSELNRIEVFNSSGTYLSQFGSYGTSDGQFERAVSLTVDSLGNIYVPDSWGNRVSVFDNKGTFITAVGTLGSGDGQFHGPLNVALDANGNMYVADDTNGRISVWNAPIVPSAPRNLKQSSLSATSVRLSWTAPANVGSATYTYKVQYRIKGAATWTTAVASLPNTTTSYTLTGLTDGAAYEARILAVNSLGESPVATISFVSGAPVTAPDTGVAPLSRFGSYVAAVIIATGAGVMLWIAKRRTILKVRW